MKLEVYTQSDAFDLLRADWKDLQERSVVNTIFNTFEWLSVWWEVYHPGNLYIVAVYRGNQLVGLAPWYIDDNRILRGVGCIDVTDYVDILVDSECIKATYDCLAQFLNDRKSDFDTIQLCNIPDSSPTLQYLPELLKQQQFMISTELIDVCPILDLPATWDDYLANLNKKQRHEVRRKLRRIYGSEVEVSWYTVTTDHDLDNEMATFFKLMAASDINKATFLENERNCTFFKSIVSFALQNGWLQLNFLIINGEAAATYLNFDYDHRILVYNSGLLIEPHGYLSPGIILLCNIIQSGIETNHIVLDFLRGNEEYKYRMGGKDTHIYQITASK